MYITRFSMKNVAAVLIVVVMLFGGGVYSALKLKIENMPDMTFPMVMITTSYTAPPQDVMEQVTKPIEDKIANVGDIESLTSTSSDSMSQIRIQFEFGVDIDKKKQDLESLIQEVSLPSDAGTPKVSTFGVTSMPSIYLALYAGEGMSQSDLDKLYDDKIEPGFEAMSGVDHIDVVGARETTMDIQLDAEAMSYYGLTYENVSTAISNSLIGGPAGSVKIDGNTQMARVEIDLDSLYAIEQMEIQTAKHGTILLKQIATIKAVNDSNFIGRYNNNPAIGIILYKTKSANAVSFSDEVAQLIESWKTSNPNIAFKTVYDGADEIRESIHGLVREGIVGALLAAVMILVFLRNVRMTLIVLVSIPLSILITLLALKQFGLTLNTMTLGGMFIAVGRVVDDSIVVIENIYANLQKVQERNESVILYATKQVGMAITSSTLATVGVFAPIGLVTGMIGEIFRPFAITVACALLASLLVALTVIPMLAKLLVLNNNSIAYKEHGQHGPVERLYEKILSWSLHHRIKTLMIAFVAFVVTLVGTVPQLAVSFVPSSKASSGMYFIIKLPYETALETTDSIVKSMEQMLREAKDARGEPLFTFVEALVGYNGDDDTQVPYAAQIYTEVNEQADADLVKKEYKQKFAYDLPAGSEVEVRSLGGGGGFSTTDFSYFLIGDDQDELEEAAALVKEKLKEFPELTEIEDSLSDAKLEVDIAIDQKKARAYGLSAGTIRTTTASWLAEKDLGEIKIDKVTYETKIELKEEDKNSLEAIRHIPLTDSSGNIVHLQDVAKVEQKEAPASLRREDRDQVVTISATIESKDKQAVSGKVSRALSQLELPDGVSRQVRGVNKDINESFSQLFMAMAVAVFVVYLMMVLAFGNASAPFAILFSLPLAAIGGLLGLVLTGESLNVTSLIGFMMLIGIVVTNAIVLIDRAQQLREEGYTVRHALIEAGLVRLRPIIMTAGATIVALIPLSLGLAEGQLISKGLAVVVIGGLTTSTLLTLVVVPIVYEMIASFKAWMARLFHRKTSVKESWEA